MYKPGYWHYLTDNRLGVYESAGKRIALGCQYSCELTENAAHCRIIALLQHEEHSTASRPFYGKMMPVVSAVRRLIIRGGNYNSTRNCEILMCTKLHGNEKLCQAQFIIQPIVPAMNCIIP